MTCTKRRYRDHLLAEMAIIKIRTQGHHGYRKKLKGKWECRPYPCTMGGQLHWHLTSQRLEERKSA